MSNTKWKVVSFIFCLTTELLLQALLSYTTNLNIVLVNMIPLVTVMLMWSVSIQVIDKLCLNSKK